MGEADRGYYQDLGGVLGARLLLRVPQGGS